MYFRYDDGFCPRCGIGLNNSEIRLCFCQNCKYNWSDEDEYDDCFDDEDDEDDEDEY